MDNLSETQDLETSFAEIDNVLFKRFFDSLGDYQVVKSDANVQQAIKDVRLNRICKLVYDKQEDNLDKFNSVLSALHSRGSSVIIVLQSDGKSTSLFFGVRDGSSSTSSHTAMETLENSLKANFPGLKSEELYSNDVEDISGLISESENVASVVGVPSLKDKDKNSFVQGIEKIIDGMSGQEYCAMIIADPVLRQDLEIVEASLHQLYSTLSFLSENQISLSENESLALGQSLSKGVTKTLTESIANSQSHTEGTNDSKGTSRPNLAGVLGGAALGAGVGFAAGGPLGAAIGTSIGLSSGGSLFGSKTTNKSTNTSRTNGKTRTNSESEAKSETTTETETATLGTGKSVQFTLKNRRVLEVLNIIDEQLERIRECKNYGMWNWGGYFFGDSKPVVRMGADIYSGVMRGESTGIERSAITVWSRDTSEVSLKNVINSLCQFKHPILKLPEEFSFRTTMPCSLISTKEVAVGMSLPQKSLPGIPVMEAVSFGRTVNRLNNCKGVRTLKIGSIHHLGNIEKNHDVELDVDSLTGHIFITGSTGSGKSNTIYSSIKSLWKNFRIPFLVIEPAKGEYKEVLGGLKGVNVFGSNPYLTPLLKINPFSFPEGIHVTEHIDRLIEILNAVWPMYAAMPAILKEAVELTYEKMGWNLLHSQCRHGRIFPDFQDLLDVLPGVINKSAYSDEMKGNYTGALLTRVRSLTNGYYRSIFQKEELPADVLFNQPCILDISRVGSSEAKALLMGVVFLKLHEYRMASDHIPNATLNHITVLEEAHHLLRRTSIEQNQEGANLQGKSVEMITNAIAEMRTYGEGFIIADQSPGLLDQSVIRNTNTKIVLRLPDWEDRELVGKAANLKNEHLEELARLETGCAAVYQNDWNEAVLCQFAKFDTEKEGKQFAFDKPEFVIADSRTTYRTVLAKILVEAIMTEKNVDSVAREMDVDMEYIRMYYPELLKEIEDGKSGTEWLFYQIKQVLEIHSIARSIEKRDDFRLWTKFLLKNIFDKLDEGMIDERCKENIIRATFEIIAREKPVDSSIWLGQIEKLEHWKELI